MMDGFACMCKNVLINHLAPKGFKAQQYHDFHFVISLDEHTIS